MLVLSESNSYSFANMVVKVTDNTIAVDDTITPKPDLPDFNVLIPTVQDVGSTNELELYYPGEPNRYLNNHGTPNPLKYGFGPDMIHGVLSKPEAGVGVYTMNLRGPSATNANVLVSMKYKVEKDVPYTDEAGQQYYVDVNGQLTTVSTDATPVVRDVLHAKFVKSYIDNCKKWIDINEALNSMYTETPDDDGYLTVPFFGVMYRGASNFGNNVYFSMFPKKAEYDGKTYYHLKVFDGVTISTTDSNYSLDVDSGIKYNTTYYIENRFNEDYPTMRFITAEGSNEISAIIDKYLYTVDELLSGTQANPEATFSDIDPFSAKYFAFVVDEGSIDTTLSGAFTLAGGDDGTETRDELFKMFFNGEILTDISSTLRYRFNYIPDAGYDADTIEAIKKLVNKRIRMTSATIMIGGTDSFQSALLEHQSKHYDTMPNIRQLARIQSPMMYNSFIRRTIRYPAMYFDLMALMDHFGRVGNYYEPFAGADCRWTGFIEDTMHYASETADYINSLQTNRINIVMKDSEDGAYLADQQMNTALTSDQTELNNAFLVSSMLYDLVQLVHRNHFKFNEAEEVRVFKDGVDEAINTKYSKYSASLSVDVYKLGTVGRAKSANKISVTINCKDINKWTDVDIILTDD